MQFIDMDNVVTNKTYKIMNFSLMASVSAALYTTVRNHMIGNQEGPPIYAIPISLSESLWSQYG